MGTFPFNFRETLPLKDTLVKTASNHNTDTTFRYIFTSARLQATNDLTLIVSSIPTLIYRLPSVTAIVNAFTKSNREIENPENPATAPDFDRSTTFTESITGPHRELLSTTLVL